MCITKVKGHATAEMVQEGKVDEADKAGNEGADAAADLGAMESQMQTYKFGDMYCRRHKAYRKLLYRVQWFIESLKKEERRLKVDKDKAEDPFEATEEKKILVPNHLKYPVGEEGVRLKMHPIHQVWYNDPEEWVGTRKVQEFMEHLQWQDEETTEGGITWLELYAL